MAAADVVIACTGAPGHVISAAMVEQALGRRRAGLDGGSRRPGGAAPLVLLDLALPRDVEPAAGLLAGASLIDLTALGAAAAGAGASGAVAPVALVAPVAPVAAVHGTAEDGRVPGGDDGQVPAADLASGTDVAAVRRIVGEELARYLQADLAERVAPTVVALRAKAATVVESELARLQRRLGDLDGRSRREIAQSMGRIADKLLHGPTVRVKELAGSPGAESYEMALRVLFELDPDAVQSVARPERMLDERPAREAGPGRQASENLEAGS
jgi:glutamyl-tRNA reductase